MTTEPQGVVRVYLPRGGVSSLTPLAVITVTELATGCTWTTVSVIVFGLCPYLDVYTDQWCGEFRLSITAVDDPTDTTQSQFLASYDWRVGGAELCGPCPTPPLDLDVNLATTGYGLDFNQLALARRVRNHDFNL